MVQLSMNISRMDHSQIKAKAIQFKEQKSRQESPAPVESVFSSDEPSAINHYYIAIDLRTIRLNESAGTANCQILFQPFYLQFSYAFFGITDYIKTYPSIQFYSDNTQKEISIPHGFIGYNFATIPLKLKYTFENIPFIVQLILEEDDTLLGTAELDLSCLLQKAPHTLGAKGDGDDNFVNTSIQVQDELNDQICEIQVVMFLQEIQNVNYCSETKEVHPNSKVPVEEAEIRKGELMDSLNDIIIETAHDIELWKEEQMRLFKGKLKQKEAEFVSNQRSGEERAKKEQLTAMEASIRDNLDKIDEREKLISQRESQIEVRQRELDEKFYTLGQEIDEAIHEVRLQYEEKTLQHRSHIKALELEKQKYQERMYQLEHRVKEKDLKIRELESKLTELGQSAQRRAQSQRATSLTRNAAGGSTTRRIVITRDAQ